jgi:DNA damage-binding protein 1
MDDTNYLFISFGDGSVMSFIINKFPPENSTGMWRYELNDRRKVILGTQPTILKKFEASHKNNVFACSDRPCVISITNQKLVYSSVNLKQVEYMCPLNTRAYKNSLAFLNAGFLRIGQMDNIQKLHIRSVQLHETARRISYQAETQSFGVITSRFDILSLSNNELKPLKQTASLQCANRYLSKSSNCLEVITKKMDDDHDNNGDVEPKMNENINVVLTTNTSGTSKSEGDSHTSLQKVYSFLILNQQTFEVLHSVQLQLYEYANSIVSMKFSSDVTNSTYYIIGTSFVDEEEAEPKRGRIVVFKYNDNKLEQVCEEEIKGAPYCMKPFNGYLLASVSNSLKLYDFGRDGQMKLIECATYTDNVFIVHLKCRNDLIMVGDMMKSCSILMFKAETKSFQFIARDYTPVWLSSIEMIDDDTYFMNDYYNNIITLKKDG